MNLKKFNTYKIIYIFLSALLYCNSFVLGVNQTVLGMLPRYSEQHEDLYNVMRNEPFDKNHFMEIMKNASEEELNAAFIYACNVRVWSYNIPDQVKYNEKSVWYRACACAILQHCKTMRKHLHINTKNLYGWESRLRENPTIWEDIMKIRFDEARDEHPSLFTISL